MSSSPGPAKTPAGPIQLSGWKEIAAYLGRSIRTVQRWEREFGLPVRRLGQSKPEGVFAFPGEVDAWLRTALGANARIEAAPPDPSESTATPTKPRPLFETIELIRMGVAAIVTAVATTVLWIILTFWMSGRGLPPAARPADWHVDLDLLVVSDASGRALWNHRFPRELDVTSYAGSPGTPRHMVGGIADIEGDGTREVWFVAKALGAPFWTALYLFEADGRVRWAYQPELTVRFGADTFGPSWIVDWVFVTPDPAGGRGKAIWAVLLDTALFPSAIQRLDASTGKPQSAYWSNGSIATAVVDASSSPPKLLVGACYNETRAGSLSVLDARDPNGSAPAELEKYRCTSCPPGGPLAFLVFPKPARFRGQDATGPVEIITPQADGRLGIRVRYATADERTFAVGVLTLDSSLTPVSADTADGYLRTYDQLAARGEVAAGAPATVDADREFFPLLRWDSAARRYVEISRRR